MPARLPRHVRAAHDGAGRARHRHPRRARPPRDGRRPLHEGRALPRPHVLRPARAAPDAARRPQGRRPVRAHHVGRGARDDRGKVRRDRRVARRARGDRAVQLCRHDGPAAVRVDGPPLLPPAGRVAARPHDLRRRRQGRLDRDDRRRDGHGLRAVREQQADPDLGQQPDRVEPALLDARAGGQAPRRAARRDRSVPQRDRREVPPARRAASRHRRRAGARPHARADRRRAGRPRLRRSLHARVSRNSRRARPHGRPSASPRRAASAPGKSWRSRASTERRSPRRSASTTACSASRAGATPCARSRACPRWSARGAIPPAAPCSRRRAPIRSTTTRWSGPT